MSGFRLRPPDRENLHGVDTGRSHLSTTSIGTLLSCQQKFNLHYEERLRQAVTPSPLALGRGFADALEAGDPETAYTVVTESALAEREEYAGNPWVSLPSEETVEVGAVTARAAARIYLQAYGHSDYSIAQRRASRLPKPLQRRVSDIRKAGRVTCYTADNLLCALGDVHLLSYMLGEDW